MVSDALSDLVARIKNGYQTRAAYVVVPYSRTGEEVVRVLVGSGYLEDIKRQDKMLTVKLKYDKGVPAMTDIVRVSKPGSRTYAGYRDIPKVWGGIGEHVVSTPMGVMNDKKAKKLKVGGELICRVW